jgi:mannose-6-phosphate isomerase-like protein (cupin superfamily)/glycerol-3-phosphate cytidylyltransferase-like family protein
MFLLQTREYTMKKVIAITSVYANPLHPGHIECFDLSRGLASELWVIVNNDHQARLKRGTESFQDEQVRMRIVESIRSVDRVVLSIDTDATVCRTLEMLIYEAQNAGHDVIFTKGGDRFAQEIPERAICDKYGVVVVDGLGEKIYSSSTFVNRISATTDPAKLAKALKGLPAEHHEHEYLEVGHRPWGVYYVLEDRSGYKVKKILVKPHQKLSLQSHEHRSEHWVVVEGVACVQIRRPEDPSYIGHIILRENESCYVPRGHVHRLGNDSNALLVLIEVQSGSYTGEDDITRYEDDYNRVPTPDKEHIRTGA